MKIAGLFLLVLVAVLPGCDGDTEPPEPCTDPAPATSVELADFAFRPDCLAVEAGATIALDNSGDAPHTFTVEGTDVDVDLDAGSSGEAELGTVAAGTYAVTCTFHPQMTATLTVG